MGFANALDFPHLHLRLPPIFMTDPRFRKLADLLVRYSTALKKSETALLDMIDVPDEFSIELIRAVRRGGGIPLVEARHTRLIRESIRDTSAEHARLVKEIEMFRMRKVQAYIAIRGSANISENSDVDSKKMALYAKSLRPLLNYRVNKTKWCVLR